MRADGAGVGEERFGGDEIGGSEPLGEAAVDRS